MYKLGIDVGGTNTDAVLIDENRAVVADIKYPTSADIYDGILGAVRKVLEVSGVDPTQIRQAMLGTTQCTNAIVERKNLAPIGILRIGAPATTGIRPMVDWAEDIKKIAVGSVIVGGGFEYDGKELAPFDEAAARAFFEEMKQKNVRSIAISCVFSTVRNDHELAAAKLCRTVMGEDVHISVSSEIGSMGLIERENATILNAALWKVAERFTEETGIKLRRVNRILQHADHPWMLANIDRDVIGGEGGFEFQVDGLIRFGEVLATLGVPENDVLHAEILEHSGGDLAGVGSGFLPVHVLCAQADLGAGERGYRRGDVHEGNADDDFDAAIAIIRRLPDSLNERRDLRGRLIHLPIASNNFRAHRIASFLKT